MVDPGTVATAAVGAATGAFTKQAIDLVGRWIATYRDEHLPKAEEAAEVNAMVFIADLTRRLSVVEEQQGDVATKERIQSALDDPDVAQVLKDAVNGASRTSNEEKAKLLARLVSERLLVSGETLLALATRQAVNTVPLLTAKQLAILGLFTVVQRIRPAEPPAVDTVSGRAQWYDWWRKAISEALPLPGVVTLMDADHLTAAGCATTVPFTESNLRDLILPEGLGSSEQRYSLISQVLESEEGTALQAIWQPPLTQLRLTSVGGLIGVMVHDERCHERTVINWD